MTIRIVICDYSGHPFQIELSRCLASRGHHVLHIHFAEFQTPKGAITVQPGDAPTFAVEGVSLGQPFDKDRFLRRRFQEVRIGKKLAARALAFRPDIVIGCNMPLDAQWELQRACARTGARFVFWLQDVYSAAIRHYLGERMGPLGQAVGRYYQYIEGKLLRSSDAVVAISETFIPPLLEWRVPPERIAVIPNWAPLSQIHLVDKNNAWARQHGLQDETVALYTGTLGLKHNPAVLLDLARAAGGLRVVVVSEGRAASWLAEQAASHRIGNLTVLPFQPMELYPQLLGTGDIVLAFLGTEAASFSVPSKILSYLAAGRPVVAAMAGDNDAARIITDAGAGCVTMPGDNPAFVGQVLRLADDPAARAAMGGKGRAFAEANFAIAPITDRFEALALTLLAGSAR